MNVGFVSTRLAGTDGVSLETAKLATILRTMGHRVFYCAGELDPDSPPGLLIPEMHFAHPQVRRIHDETFVGPASPDLKNRLVAFADQLKNAIASFVDRFSIDLLFPENVLALPMHPPLGLALSRFIAERGIRTVAHHHDFYWERVRFAAPAWPALLADHFPPNLPTMRHLVINRLAQEELKLRHGISAWVLPNIFDFEAPQPDPNPFSADLRQALGIGDSDLLFLQPTRVVPRKGIELSINLLQRLADPRCVLVISHQAGDEGMSYLSQLKELASQSGVAFLYAAERFGPTRRTTADGTKVYNLWDAYQHADFVTYPSLVEGFGNALLETIYFRLPAMVNRYPVYVADIAPKGFRFIEIEGTITDETVAQVRSLLENPARRQAIVEHNIALARQHYSYSVARKLIEEVLTEF
jgi:glycosyltransferase involved in cell wall biosynthesis